MSVLKARVDGAWVEVGGILPAPPTPLGAAVQGAIGMPVPSAAWTKIPLQGTVYWADTSVFTVDLVDLVCQQAGRYNVTATLMISLAHTTTQRLGVDIYVNGAIAVPRIHTGTTTPLSQFVMPVTTTGNLMLAVGDRLSMYCYHQTGADRVIADPTWLAVERVGGVKGDKGDTGSGSTVIVQEEGTQVANRPALNFVGTRLTATDDAANSRALVTADDRIVAYRGAYNPSTSYVRGDVVRSFQAMWVWDSSSASTPGQAPGTSVSQWYLFGGTPQMAQAEIDAWTIRLSGDTVWNETASQLQVYDSGWKTVGRKLIKSATGTTYAPILTDENTLINLSNASAITVTMPSDATLAVPTGAEIHFFQGGTGQATFVAGASAVVNATPGLKMRARWSGATAIKTSANTWVLFGDLSA